jgi:aspartyl-tRNA(Asn)/glutamyl-tRNA(Gln) amidotransferase subunit A
LKNAEITKMTVQELSKGLKAGDLTSVEIVKAYFEQIDKTDSKVHAFLALDEAKALKAAAESDARRSQGSTLSELDGIPVAIKDVILTEGLVTTASSKMLEGFVPLEDATVVKKLKEAGAIIIGKNNCDAWAHGGSTENSDYGTTHNPWDLDRVPGGSSGGSAACVAADQAPVSIGTDTGGSIRQPAGFCGVVGIKPTYGLCSRYGLIAMASSLDVPGPMTKTVYDNAAILSVMAGADKKDATSAGSKPKDYLSNINGGVKGLKIGLPKEYFSNGLNPEVKKAVMAAAEELKKAGAEIVEIELPMTKYGIATYYVIQPAEVSSNLGRYDGIKYGYTAPESNNLIDQYFKSRTQGLGDEAKRRIMLGTYVLSAGYFDAYYNKAMKVRSLIKKDFDDAFKKVDVILGPTSPTTAFKIGGHSGDPLAMYLEDVYTVNVNLAGIPSLAVPCGNIDGLPVGMQIMGPQFSEDIIYRVGRSYESATKDADWRNLSPKF